MSDPLRTGKIFQIDPTIMKRMRPSSSSFSNSSNSSSNSSNLSSRILSENTLELLRKDELIPGIKAKFDDVFRSTPNPMNALFGLSPSNHSYSSHTSINSNLAYNSFYNHNYNQNQLNNSIQIQSHPITPNSYSIHSQVYNSSPSQNYYQHSPQFIPPPPNPNPNPLTPTLTVQQPQQSPLPPPPPPPPPIQQPFQSPPQFIPPPPPPRTPIIPSTPIISNTPSRASPSPPRAISPIQITKTPIISNSSSIKETNSSVVPNSYSTPKSTNKSDNNNSNNQHTASDSDSDNKQEQLIQKTIQQQQQQQQQQNHSKKKNVDNINVINDSSNKLTKVTHSTPKQLIEKESNKTIINGNSKSEVKRSITSTVNERLVTSESKKIKNKNVNRPRVCDSLMMLFAPSPNNKNENNNQNNSLNQSNSTILDSTSKSNLHNQDNNIDDIDNVDQDNNTDNNTDNNNNDNSESPLKSHQKSNSSLESNSININQKLFISPEKKRKLHSSPSSEKISKRTRSRTKSRTSQQSILTQLNETKRETRNKDRKEEEEEGEGEEEEEKEQEKGNSKKLSKSHNKQNIKDVKNVLEVNQNKNNSDNNVRRRRRSNSPTLSEESFPIENKSIEQNRKIKKDQTENQSTKGILKKKKKVENIESVDPNYWSSIEIQALQQAHRSCPVEAPLFWDVVAHTLNNILKDQGYKVRTSEECFDRWYLDLNKMKEAKKRNNESQNKSITNQDDETTQRPKRRTQARMRKLLEEAFIGEADDIFEINSKGHDSNLSITPHKETLQSSSLNSIFSVKSPNDVQNGNDQTQSKNSKTLKKSNNSNSNNSNIFQEKESNWEASYVGKIKKQQKSRKSLNEKKSTSTSSSSSRRNSNSNKYSKLKKSSNNLQESSEITIDERGKKTQLGLQVEARINSRGKVDVSLKGDRLDDDDEEAENIKKWIHEKHNSGDDDEDEEDSEDESEQSENEGVNFWR